MHHVARGAFQLRRGPRVFAAAEIGGEAVLIRHPHAALRPLVGRKQQAAAFGIDRHAPALHLPAPAGQIGRDQRLARHRRSLPFRRPVRRPHLHAATVAIEFRRHAGVIGLRAALGETPAAQRQRQVALVGDVGGLGFLDRALEQRRVVAEHAEAEAVRAAFLDAVRRRAGHRITAQATGEHADRGNVVAAAPMSAAHAPHVDAVRERIERAVRPADAVAAARDRAGRRCRRDADAGDRDAASSRAGGRTPPRAPASRPRRGTDPPAATACPCAGARRSCWPHRHAAPARGRARRCSGRLPSSAAASGNKA